jgi:hypothetical protein
VPGDEIMSFAEIAFRTAACSRCGAVPGESCASRMRSAAAAAGDRKALAELLEIERCAPYLAHRERLDEAEELVRSAEAYGLVRRLPARRARR